MTSRRVLIASGAFCSLTGLPAFAAQEAKKPFVEGQDYTLVDPPVKLPARPIIIHDFFAYTCPHCLRLAPLMEAYRKSIETDPLLKIVPVPVAWEESHELFPQIYFGFEALGRLQDLHMSFWEWVMQEDHPWEKVDDARGDIDKWVVAHGLDLKKWQSLINGFAIKNKVKQASDTWRHYGLDSTPCIGIAGRFLTAPHMTGSRPRAIEAVKMLVERAKTELKAE